MVKNIYFLNLIKNDLIFVSPKRTQLIMDALHRKNKRFVIIIDHTIYILFIYVYIVFLRIHQKALKLINCYHHKDHLTNVYVERTKVPKRSPFNALARSVRAAWFWTIFPWKIVFPYKIRVFFKFSYRIALWFSQKISKKKQHIMKCVVCTAGIMRFVPQVYIPYYMFKSVYEIYDFIFLLRMRR